MSYKKKEGEFSPCLQSASRSFATISSVDRNHRVRAHDFFYQIDKMVSIYLVLISCLTI